MPTLILHKDGAYNLYTTVADGPCYESALTIAQLRKIIRFEGGQNAIDALPERLERAHRTGCSSLISTSLEDCISANRAGPNETCLSTAEFIDRFLTLKRLT